MNMLINCLIASFKLTITIIIMLIVVPTVFIFSMTFGCGPLGCLLTIILSVMLISALLPIMPIIFVVLLVLIFLASLFGILKPASIANENDRLKSYINQKYEKAAKQRKSYQSDDAIDAECKEVKDDK